MYVLRLSSFNFSRLIKNEHNVYLVGVYCEQIIHNINFNTYLYNCTKAHVYVDSVYNYETPKY